MNVSDFDWLASISLILFETLWCKVMIFFMKYFHFTYTLSDFYIISVFKEILCTFSLPHFDVFHFSRRY